MVASHHLFLYALTRLIIAAFLLLGYENRTHNRDCPDGGNSPVGEEKSNKTRGEAGIPLTDRML